MVYIWFLLVFVSTIDIVEEKKKISVVQKQQVVEQVVAEKKTSAC